MIGQESILEWIEKNSQKLSNFIIFVGPRGSGKTMLAKTVAQKLNANFTICGIKVDEVRETINTAYTVADKTVYCIKDADTMSPGAKNAMLKITEEPPKNAHFILTVQDESSLLGTIKSRGVVFNLQPYTTNQLKEYCIQKYGEVDEVAVNSATTPYEVDLMVKYGKEFVDYVELVVNNIAEVQPANAFKSAGKLAFKDEADKYDLHLFFSVFVDICMKRLKDDPLKYSKGICATMPHLLKCTRLGVNKSQLYDMWVFRIREVW